jgi:hypothetical protein
MDTALSSRRHITGTGGGIKEKNITNHGPGLVVVAVPVVKVFPTYVGVVHVPGVVYSHKAADDAWDVYKYSPAPGWHFGVWSTITKHILRAAAFVVKQKFKKDRIKARRRNESRWSRS